jgi:hypothetical protein
MMNRNRKVFWSLLLFLIAILFSLAMGEGIVRLLAPQQLIVLNERIWKPDSVLSWRHVIHADEHVNLGEKTVRFVSDEHGFRINAQEPEPKRCAESILFLGDSFLEALQVENESTFVQLLQRKIINEHKQELCVVNTGVGGWGPNHYYMQARAELRRHNYSLGVVCLYVGNDVVSRFDTNLSPRAPVERHMFRIPRSLVLSEWRDAVFYPVNDFLETRSHLFLFLKMRGQTLLSRAGLTAEYFPPIFNISYAQSSAWATTADICYRIKLLFDERSIPTLFVLIPAPYQVHDEVFRDFVRGFGIDERSVDLMRPNRILAEQLSRRGITLLDPLLAFRAKASHGKTLYGKIDNHFNEEGHRALCEFLFPYAVQALSTSKGR